MILQINYNLILGEWSKIIYPILKLLQLLVYPLDLLHNHHLQLSINQIEIRRNHLKL
jgi:hypothetical protein